MYFYQLLPFIVNLILYLASEIIILERVDSRNITKLEKLQKNLTSCKSKNATNKTSALAKCNQLYKSKIDDYKNYNLSTTHSLIIIAVFQILYVLYAAYSWYLQY